MTSRKGWNGIASARSSVSRTDDAQGYRRGSRRRRRRSRLGRTIVQSQGKIRRRRWRRQHGCNLRC